MPIHGKCDLCGAPISMPPSQWARSVEHFCSRQCHMAKMNADPITNEWWKLTRPCFTKFKEDSESTFYEDMRQIFQYEGY